MPYDSSRSKSANLQRILADRLPDEVILPTSWRRAVMAVFLTVLLVVAVNLFARWYLDSYPSNRGYWLAREKWKLLESLSEPVDWLIPPRPRPGRRTAGHHRGSIGRNGS